ncbi:MAG: hypothetical protein LBB41_00945 [Prevotellaceae bacterium]|jgi:hypothetical protein|nr:hypothetical protein [Prevotellaceae bacterium]
MAKVFSWDLGTNSIDYAKRNLDAGKNLAEQLDLFGVVRFQKNDDIE